MFRHVSLPDFSIRRGSLQFLLGCVSRLIEDVSSRERGGVAAHRRGKRTGREGSLPATLVLSWRTVPRGVFCRISHLARSLENVKDATEENVHCNQKMNTREESRSPLKNHKQFTLRRKPHRPCYPRQQQCRRTSQSPFCRSQSSPPPPERVRVLY